MPIPSPAVMNQIGNRFRREVKAFAQDHSIPLLRLNKPDRTRWDDRKLDHVRPHLDRAEREGRVGVVAIVSAQEFAWVFSDRRTAPLTPGVPTSSSCASSGGWGRTTSTCTTAEFGPGFVKICHLLPLSRPRCGCNGHEWAKRQADHVPASAYRCSSPTGSPSCERSPPAAAHL